MSDDLFERIREAIRAHAERAGEDTAVVTDRVFKRSIARVSQGYPPFPVDFRA